MLLKHHACHAFRASQKTCLSNGTGSALSEGEFAKHGLSSRSKIITSNPTQLSSEYSHISPKRCSRSTQNPPKDNQKQEKTLLSGPLEQLLSPNRQGLQNSPKMGTQVAPKAPQSSPKAAQGGPKCPQGGQKAPKRLPKGTPE